MHEQMPWTLQEKELRVRKSPYIRNKEANLEISTQAVKRLFKENSEKTFTNNEIAETLGISLGTVSDITNRLEAIQDIKIVKVRQLRSALSQVFQHSSGSMRAVIKERGKADAVICVYETFQASPNRIFTKNDLLSILDNTEGKIRRSLQILLLDELIKLVGCDDRGCAQYQYCKGNAKGIKIYKERTSGYMTISEFTQKYHVGTKSLKDRDVSKSKLFYSSKGLLREYPEDYLKKLTKIK